LRFYLPYFQMPHVRRNWIPASTRFLIRAAVGPAGLVPVLRQVIPSEDPRLSVASLDLGPDLVRRLLVQERAVATLLVAFGVLALGLAAVGLYGLIAYQVVRRRSEIGIRMALGARRRDVMWAMLRRGFVWIACGTAVGVPVALIASRVTQGLLFGVSATDPATLIGAAGMMAAVGLLAAYIPARRASRVDPAVALRCE
jgi:ABC-type antimicrobial peptide transport system permease subunit